MCIENFWIGLSKVHKTQGEEKGGVLREISTNAKKRSSTALSAGSFFGRFLTFDLLKCIQKLSFGIFIEFRPGKN